MAQTYETLLHRWFEEVWNQGQEDVIDELFPDGLAYGLGTEPVRGSRDYKPFFRAFKDAFPDLKITVDDWVLDGDKLAVHCRATGTHQGSGLGFAPTKQSIDFSFMGFARIQDNKILEAWNILDSAKMYEQLGVLSLKKEPNENENLIRRWFEEVWNSKRESAIDEMLNDNSVHYGLGGVENTKIRGTHQFREFYKEFLNAFPDIHVTVEEVISSGERVCARCTVRATHTGKAFGIEPTNNKIEFTGNGICTVRDGKFVEVWNEFDFLKMYHQIGLINFGK